MGRSAARTTGAQWEGQGDTGLGLGRAVMTRSSGRYVCPAASACSLLQWPRCPTPAAMHCLTACACVSFYPTILNMLCVGAFTVCRVVWPLLARE